MPHIVLDLETMSTASDAAIVALGAVRISPTTDVQILDTFYTTINLKSSQRAGGKLDADTVMWWLSQPEEARKFLIGDDSILIESALSQFSNWVREQPLEGMWGNGSDFDNVVLANSYYRLGKTPPWTYKENRCYRTMSAVFPNLTRGNFILAGEVKHNALHDALAQGRHLCAMLKHEKVT